MNLLLLVDKYDIHSEEDKEKIRSSGRYILVDDSTSKHKLGTGTVYDAISDEAFRLSLAESVIHMNALRSVDSVSSYETPDEDVKYTGYRYLHLLENLVS
jgi:hypothetical protein